MTCSGPSVRLSSILTMPHPCALSQGDAHHRTARGSGRCTGGNTSRASIKENTMKKLIAVPVVAVVAAVAAASAAGFAGGVSAGPLQIGRHQRPRVRPQRQESSSTASTTTRDPPYIDNARVQLDGSAVRGPGRARHRRSTPGAPRRRSSAAPQGSELRRHGTQHRPASDVSTPRWNAENLKSVRISVDPGYAGHARDGHDQLTWPTADQVVALRVQGSATHRCHDRPPASPRRLR